MSVAGMQVCESSSAATQGVHQQKSGWIRTEELRLTDIPKWQLSSCSKCSEPPFPPPQSSVLLYFRWIFRNQHFSGGWCILKKKMEERKRIEPQDFTSLCSIPTLHAWCLSYSCCRHQRWVCCMPAITFGQHRDISHSKYTPLFLQRCFPAGK